MNIRFGLNHDPEFICPECGIKSWHPMDRKHGWCGRCKKFTGTPQLENEDEQNDQCAQQDGRT